MKTRMLTLFALAGTVLSQPVFAQTAPDPGSTSASFGGGQPGLDDASSPAPAAPDPGSTAGNVGVGQLPPADPSSPAAAAPDLGTDPDTGQPLVAADDDDMGQAAAAMNTQSQAAAATDPETAAIQGGATIPPVPTALASWTETANRVNYNSTISTPWSNFMGDYDPTPVAKISVPDTDKQRAITATVTGNDFYILNSGGGSANFYPRTAASNVSPKLVVNGKTYQATRNIALLSGQSTPLTGAPYLTDKQAFLVAFDGYNPKQGDVAKLILTTNAHQYGAHTLTVYHTNIQYSFPTIDAVQDGTVVADFHGNDLGAGNHGGVSNNITTGSWGPWGLTAIEKLKPLPPAQEYFMTVVLKLWDNLTNQGGKLPGLSNSGQGTNTSGAPLIIDGLNCSNSGWGGRPANGCRWSARTGWGGRSGNLTGLHTYFYAQNPSQTWGVIQNWPMPAPVGKWFAYVERVRVNTPGNGDGRLSYWMCTQQGCAPQIDVQGITWSAGTIPESLITEAWADVYCGGTSCGPSPTAISTTSISRMTVTVGLPDLDALYQEVQALNASGQ